jgi:hypothetical protein
MLIHRPVRLVCREIVKIIDSQLKEGNGGLTVMGSQKPFGSEHAMPARFQQTVAAKAHE